MNRYHGRPNRPQFRPVYFVVINPSASGYNKKHIDYLTGALKGAGKEFQLIETATAEDTAFQLRRVIEHRAYAVIACGGDGTVNLTAHHMVRRTPVLGIYPLGRMNNIYRSLYGEPDLKEAVTLILGGKNRRIDHGLAGGKFFLGSIGMGLLPELFELMRQKKPPRFGITWSRHAGQAASNVTHGEVSIKIDAFRFDLAPRMLNINLLPYSAGLPLTPASIDDDGKGEVIFDIGRDKPILTSFIRQIIRKKYIYSDEIRMFRGNKISISPAAGKKLYLDGEIIKFPLPELEIEIFEQKIRIFTRPEK